MEHQQEEWRSRWSSVGHIGAISWLVDHLFDLTALLTNRNLPDKKHTRKEDPKKSCLLGTVCLLVKIAELKQE